MEHTVYNTMTQVFAFALVYAQFLSFIFVFYRFQWPCRAVFSAGVGGGGEGRANFAPRGRRLWRFFHLVHRVSVDQSQ